MKNNKLTLLPILAFTAVGLIGCSGKGNPTSIYDPYENVEEGEITGQKTFKEALEYDYSNYYAYVGMVYADGEASEEEYMLHTDGVTAVFDYTYASSGIEDAVLYYADATIDGQTQNYLYFYGDQVINDLVRSYFKYETDFLINEDGVRTLYTREEVLANSELLQKHSHSYYTDTDYGYAYIKVGGEFGGGGMHDYYHSGWMSKGYRDADLSMYHAYFSLERLLAHLTVDDVEKILGDYYVKEEALDKINEYGFEFYSMVGQELTAIQFQLSSQTGAISKIVATVSDRSDDCVIIQLFEVDDPIAVTQISGFFYRDFPRKPYYNSDTDRNIYLYKEMSPTWVPDVWPTSLELVYPDGYELVDGQAVLEIGESVDVEVLVLPEGVNRLDLEWVIEDESIIDVNYKQNPLLHHKFVTGVEPGTSTLKVRALGEDGNYVTSNVLTFVVSELPEIDKTNAVYDIEITGSEFRKDESGNIDKNITDFKFINYAVTEYDPECEIVGHNVKTIACDGYTEAWDGKPGFVAYAQPLSQEYMSSGFYSEMVFDFGDQQVVSMSFYYALRFSTHAKNFHWLTDAYIATSNDGEIWSEPIDMLSEMSRVFDTYNSDYNAFAKIITRTFPASSKVKIFYKSSMVGPNLDICMKNFVFRNDETCHNHDGSAHPLTGLVIEASKTNLKPNETTFAQVTEFIPANASKKVVTWHSTNEDIVSIDETTGKITAKTNGTSEVYALGYNGVESNHVTISVETPELPSELVGKEFYNDSFYATYKGTYQEIGAKISLNSKTNATLNIFVGGNLDLSISLIYDNVDGRTYTFLSLDGKNGVLNLTYSSFGTDDVRYVSDDFEISDGINPLEFKELKHATSLSLSIDDKSYFQSSFECYDNETHKFTFSVNPSDAYIKNVSLSSDNEDLVLIEPYYSSFKISCKHSISEETIVTLTASCDGVSKQISLIIKPFVKAQGLTLTTINGLTELPLEGSLELVCKTTNTPTNVKYTFESSNKDILTVNKDGVVKAGKIEGSAVITVTEEYSGLTASITLEVTKSAEVKELHGKWAISFGSVTYEITIPEGISKVNPTGSVMVFGSYTSDESSFFQGGDMYYMAHKGNTYEFHLCDEWLGVIVLTLTTNTDQEIVSATLQDVDGCYFGDLEDLWNGDPVSADNIERME